MMMNTHIHMENGVLGRGCGGIAVQEQGENTQREEGARHMMLVSSRLRYYRLAPLLIGYICLATPTVS